MSFSMSVFIVLFLSICLIFLLFLTVCLSSPVCADARLSIYVNLYVNLFVCLSVDQGLSVSAFGVSVCICIVPVSQFVCPAVYLVAIHSVSSS